MIPGVDLNSHCYSCPNGSRILFMIWWLCLLVSHLSNTPNFTVVVCIKLILCENWRCEYDLNWVLVHKLMLAYCMLKMDSLECSNCMYGTWSKFWSFGKIVIVYSPNLWFLLLIEFYSCGILLKLLEIRAFSSRSVNLLSSVLVCMWQNWNVGCLLEFFHIE